ncbi:MAG: hypothetical protein R3E01_35540 [Pirellulaceae bacterium]|nr:hypothetical protein [Planctomycetales bacterium]
METIRCLPQGICSWNFYVTDGARNASIEFNWVGEQGRIVVDGVVYDIDKGGWLSGHWELNLDGQRICSAQKASIFTRTFDMTTETGQIRLSAVAPVSRSMRLEGDGFSADIVPVHPWTRRTNITGTIPDLAVACFAFWLTVLLWKRQAEND